MALRIRPSSPGPGSKAAHASTAAKRQQQQKKKPPPPPPNQVFVRLSTDGKDQYAETPPSIFELLFRMYGRRELFDPCPARPAFDGLAVPWGPLNYINPPFSDARAWIAKARQEAALGKHSVVLIPARTHTKYFFTEIMAAATDVYILTNAVRFIPYEGPFPIPILMCTFGPPPGGRPPVLPSDLVSVREVPARCIRVNGHATDVQTMPYLQARYGPFERVVAKARAPADVRLCPGSNFVAVMGQAAQCAEAIAAHHARHPRSRTCVVIMSRYCTRWFRERLAPLTAALTFMSPAMTFSEYGSVRGITGSVVLHLGGFREAPPGAKLPRLDAIVSPARTIKLLSRADGGMFA
jgi:hypothetical protein